MITEVAPTPPPYFLGINVKAKEWLSSRASRDDYSTKHDLSGYPSPVKARSGRCTAWPLPLTAPGCALLANHQRTDKIATRSLEEQIKAAKETRKTCILNNLTQDHRILYEIVKQKRRILSGDLWEEYLQHCSRLRRKPLASRTFSDYANRLIQASLITSERARVRGKVRLFRVVA